jgi:hypothetical protein
MTEEPLYKPRPLPEDLVDAREHFAAKQAAELQAVQPEMDAAITVARDALDRLDRYHAAVADRTDLDLSFKPGSRPLALWESTAAAIGLSRAFVDLIALGYHAQILPTYRAIHEVLGVVSVLDDENETEFLTSWLADEEVRQRKVRAAATRQTERLAEQMADAGIEDAPVDAGQTMKKLYGPLSDVSHGRRSAVRTYISEPLRLAETGSHPDPDQRLAHHEQGLLLIEQVVLVVGAALWTLHGGTFYRDRIEPLQDAVHQAAEHLARVRLELGR